MYNNALQKIQSLLECQYNFFIFSPFVHSGCHFHTPTDPTPEYADTQKQTASVFNVFLMSTTNNTLLTHGLKSHRTVYMHQSTKCKKRVGVHKHSLCTPTRFLLYLVWTQTLVHTHSSLYGLFILVWTFPFPLFTPCVWTHFSCMDTL